MVTINIMKEFARTPGSRYREDGPHSGQEFRERLLEPNFKDEKDESKVTIVLDGTEGFATSFLEEAFGGLARIYGKKRCLEKLVFISAEDPMLIDEIKYYIEQCNEK